MKLFAMKFFGTLAAFVAVVASFGAPCTVAQTSLRLTVLDAAGKPVKASYCSLVNTMGSGQPFATKQEQGAKLVVAGIPSGVYRCVVAAPNAGRTDFPVIVGKTTKKEAEKVECTVRLAHYSYAPTLTEVSIVGDWNGFRAENASAMTKQNNGTFTYEATAQADTLTYQLVALDGQEGHTMNGTMQDYCAYDGGGDFRSVLRVKKGAKVTIVFDPKKLVRNPATPELPIITFDKAHQNLQAMASLESKTNQRAAAFYKKTQGRTPSEADYEALDSELRAIYESVLKSEDHPQAKVLAALRMSNSVQPLQEQEHWSRLRALIPLNDEFWGMEPYTLGRMIARDSLAFQEFLAKHPSHAFKGRVVALGMLASVSQNQPDRATTMYKELKTNYADVQDPVVRRALSMNPTLAVAKGKPVPDFSVKLMNTGETVSNTSLKGKVYMMDFWAVWCGPCRGELPGLHAAHQKFKDKFTVLSLSFDRAEADVEKFRAKPETPMPWLHTFVEKGFQSDLAKAFEVRGIPKPILVDAQGIIVATDGELRGASLEKTLARVVGEPTAAAPTVPTGGQK